MKKWLLGLMAIMFLTGVVLVGCSDDDDNPVNPGDPNDPDFQAFTEEFSQVDDVIGQLAGMPLMYLDTIMNSQVSAPAALSPADVVIEWHSASGFWVITDEQVGDFVTMSITDSLQFLEGTTVVQWPNEELLTEIRSYLTLVATADFIDTAYGFQNVVYEQWDQDSNYVELNGTGGIYYDILNDETGCHAVLDYDYSVMDFVADPELVTSDESSQVDGCPLTGTVAYSGDVSIDCLSQGGGLLEGSWAVSRTFVDETETVVVNNGEYQWTIVHECDAEVLR